MGLKITKTWNDSHIIWRFEIHGVTIVSSFYNN
jgi:hypothetical protein